MGNQDDTTKNGLEILFRDAFEPPLTGGEYTVGATQTLTLKNNPSPDGFGDEKTVYVSAPRFALDPGDIYSVYPPDGQSGAFHSTLPHIVFTRKTLPWEREIDGSGGASRPPWMSLLTLDDDEVAQHVEADERKGEATAGADDNVLLHTVPLPEVFNPKEKEWTNKDDGIWRATIPREPGERKDAKPEDRVYCLVADMPTSLFRRIAPRREELRYLAHARQVGTEDKDIADAVADGWFSAVIGNRLPAQGKRTHGLLVSLEGFGAMLEQEVPAGLPGKVRLAVLKHWTYVSEDLTFLDLLKGLTKSGGGKTEKDVWLRVSSSQKETDNATVRNALERGYTALSHSTRQGDRTVSWYRGPLIPTPLNVGTENPIYANVDEALRYDPDTGLFDVSYAAAWQLGRLLSLQKSDFAQSLLQRRSGYVATETLELANTKLKEWHGEDGGIESQKAKLLLQDDLMVAILTEWWLSEAAKSDGSG